MIFTLLEQGMCYKPQNYVAYYMPKPKYYLPHYSVAVSPSTAGTRSTLDLPSRRHGKVKIDLGSDVFMTVANSYG